ncbi:MULTISPECIES: ParA family protein [Rhodanobacteraceae]|uniref:ParA family protein n=1 Tax=Rhodanobacteraceae TaxID=1775411 RepID=UPI0008833629|nr:MULTISPECIES: ParA family protein [Rhodanobacteraceae]MDR6643265.1 chromosome partitioning protein [Luteibacter sp. 1214]SDF10547.1 chromosome partitioning protein [Dyella sp. 333MFSha]SKB92431.1 chromosome partitioning protein [Luteibacter sp. 22Crub2.1]
MITWAVSNQKGGVGKTTTTVALGSLLAASGKRTLLIDMDPHASLSGYIGVEGGAHGSVYDLFGIGNSAAPLPVRTLVHATQWDRLSVLPASPAMITLDRQLGTRPGMGLVLTQALAELAPDFDHVLLDCPPTLGVLMVNALAASDRLLVPTQTEALALAGLERMLRSLSMIERSRGRPLPRTIVPTMFDSRTHASRVCLDQLREQYGDSVSQAVIPTDTQIREASAAGVPLASWPAARRGGLAYRQLLDELLAPPAVDAASTVASATAPATDAAA